MNLWQKKPKQSFEGLNLKRLNPRKIRSTRVIRDHFFI